MQRHKSKGSAVCYEEKMMHTHTVCTVLEMTHENVSQSTHCLSRNLEGFQTFFAVWNPSSLFSAFLGSSGAPDEGAGLPAAVVVVLACSRARHPPAPPPRPNSLGGPEGAGLSERGGVRTGGGGWAEGVRRHTPSCEVVVVAAGGCLRLSSARRAASSSLCCCSLIRSRSAARCLSRSSRIRAA